ncbi:MAG TPA: histidinol-phosphate transaminase [Planctomycetes bacterium]|nr:histidinol-phosphate transaminase [Planctomycetota bacterium]
MSYFRENIENTPGYTPGFQPAGADVVKLNTNENPYPASPKVLEAIRNVSSEQLRRYPKPLGDDFRLAAAEMLGVSADNIICTKGGDELLSICFRAFCDDNRPVAYPVPTYSLYPVLAQLQNCRRVEVDFGGEFSLPAELADTNAALTIVCNPNAPTGTFIKPEDLRELAKKLNGKSILLIDEAYVDFAEGDCVGLACDFDNVIILRSMSKGYSLAGLRFGYGIACRQLIDGLRKVKDSYNVDAVSVAAATAAIKDRDYFRKNVEKVKADRQILTVELKRLGFTVTESKANFLLAQLEGAGGIYRKLAEQNIYIRYFDQPHLSDKLRITVGTKVENEKLIGTLKKIISM